MPLNKDQEFIVWVVSRGQIAKELNDVIREDKLAIPLFALDDSRLTSKICKQFAQYLSEADPDDPVDYEGVAREIIANHFQSKPGEA